MAIVPPRLLTPAQTLRFLHELDRNMNADYVSEIVGVNFIRDTNFMFVKAASYKEVDAFATRRFASLVYARQCGSIDTANYTALTSAISTLLRTFNAMESDNVPVGEVFPAKIDLFEYLPISPRRP